MPRCFHVLVLSAVLISAVHAQDFAAALGRLSTMGPREVAALRLAAKSGNARAENSLGLAYATGTAVPKDEAAAFRWFRRAANHGSEAAENNVGLMYRMGSGVMQDAAESVLWFRRAAEHGLSFAQYNLGLAYYEGNGIKQNYEEALKWFMVAALKGHAGAQNNVGAMYNHGWGVERNDQEAARWFRMAAEQGYGTAQTNLAVILAQENHELSDHTAAYTWALIANAAGDAKSQAVRQVLSPRLAPEELQKAESQAAQWVQAHRPATVKTHQSGMRF